MLKRCLFSRSTIDNQAYITSALLNAFINLISLSSNTKLKNKFIHSSAHYLLFNFMRCVQILKLYLDFFTLQFNTNALRKHAYSNILKILLPKNENFLIKILIFFIFLLKT